MTSYHIVAAQESTPAKKGKIFYVARRLDIEVGATDNLILSGNSDGEGNFNVDDTILVIIQENGDPTNIAFWRHDFSNNCAGGPVPLAPVNLNDKNPDFNKFRGKTVTCIIRCADRCSGVTHSTDIFLTVQPES